MNKNWKLPLALAGGLLIAYLMIPKSKTVNSPLKSGNIGRVDHMSYAPMISRDGMKMYEV